MPTCKQCQGEFEGAYRAKFCSAKCQLDNKAGSPTRCGCIEWRGAIGAHGYGVIKVARKLWTTHRLAYSLYSGPIQDNMHVLHSCDNRKCINPSHLFLGTHQDNMQDMTEKGRAAFQGKNRSKIDLEKMRAGRAAHVVTPSEKQRSTSSRNMRALWSNPEFRAKMSVSGSAHKDHGKSMNESQRAKMQAYWDSLKGKKRPPHSEETKAKMRQAALRRYSRETDA